ncbi:hypothetical protein BJV82DRAFT_617430 [Fennellomyces sp. T-0311]|nr:hypothetical protein BJV82DRAFT_617430 [Fennellomyces sp. T-0311]
MGHVRKKDDSQLLKLCHGSDGQAHIHVHHDQQSLEKRPKNLRVSRIVANAFVDGYSETQNAVEHINGDRLDNRAQNLKWVPQRSAYIQRRSRPVVASLMDNPEMQKRFPSISKAQQELSVFSLYSLARKHVNSFTKEVNWDGEKKLASIQVFLSKKDQE